jgi:glycosyltransferase involved in cell wall biosynthesis
MRIAHFVHRYPPALGGAEAYFARLSRYLVERGDHVQVCTTNALDLEAFWSPRARTLPAGAETVNGVEVRRYPLRHWFGQRYWLTLLSLIPHRLLQAFWLPCNPIVPELWRDCGQRWDIDIVHATALPYAFPILCALRTARIAGVPFVLTPFLHLGDPRQPDNRTRRAYLSPAMRYLLEAADAIFVQTELERQALLGIGLPPERLILQGLGVDPAECTGGNRQAARQRWALPEQAIVIGHLANKSVEKGTVDLLRAVPLFPLTGKGQGGGDCRLLLAGPEMPNFLRVWNDFPRKERVVKLGVLSEAERRDFYAAIDVFALPSRSDSFGLVLLEAWANGIPCVGYRAGGVAEVIRHGVDGLLVPCGDVAGLAEVLGRLTADAALRLSLGAAGRQRVERDCTWAPPLELVRDVYADRTRAARRLASRRQRLSQGEPVTVP